MKKITLLIAMFCTLSAFSTRYLVQGTTGTNTWRPAGAGEVNVTTSDFRTWYYATFPGGYTYNSADEIWLAGGTYILSYSFGTRKISVYGGFAGTETSISQRSKVTGGKPWEFTTPTILDGNNAIPQGVTTQSTATTPTTYIDGVTITKCKVTNVTAHVYGVGAYITQGWVMQNCIVSNNIYNNTAAANSFDGNGAGIYLAGGQVLDSYIYNNQLIKGNGRNTYGGGMAFAYNASSPNTVKGCTFENNFCTQFGGGLEIILGNTGTIEDNIFKTNSTAGLGGGIGATNTGAGGANTLTIKNCQFIDNTSTTGAGAADINLLATTVGTTNIEGCTFSGNVGYNVGALCCYSGTYNIKKNTFLGNKNTSTANGTSDASALFTSSTAITNLQNCIFANNTSVANTGKNHTAKLTAGGNVYNCTFANNYESGSAGYTFTFNAAVGTIKNCVFWGNTNTANFSGVGNNGTSNYNATTSDKNTNGVPAGGTTGNINTLTISPNNTFVSPTTFVGVPSTSDGGMQKAQLAAADWRLKIGAPAINAGIDLAASGVATDVLGNNRPTGSGAVDMGAYEAVVVPGTNNISALTTNSTSEITIPSGGHLTVDATKTLAGITIESGGKLTNNGGQTLTLTNLNLKSDANGTATYVENGGTSVITNSTVQQYLTGARNWYVSSPVASASRSVVINASNLYKYDEASASWVIENSLFNPCTGYIASSTATQTVSFTGGTLNTGTQTISNLSWGASDASKKGFNLVGNPYPSYLDWEQVSKTGILSTIWYRSRNSGNTAYVFDTYNATSHVGTSLNGSAVTQYIPPMQAFWVRATSATNSLTFTNNMRSHETGTNRLKSKKMSEQRIIRLRVSNNINEDESILLFDQNATNTYDDYDSPKRFNNTINVPEIYTQSDNVKLVINCMKEIPYNTEIPLGFSTQEAHDFSISNIEMSNFEPETKLYLVDKLYKTEIELGIGKSYNFSSEVISSSTDRFGLIFKVASVTTDLQLNKLDESQVFVNVANKITVKAPQGTKYEIINSIGQKIMNKVLMNEYSTIDKEFESGVYYVVLHFNEEKVTKKVLIR